MSEHDPKNHPASWVVACRWPLALVSLGLLAAITAIVVVDQTQRSLDRAVHRSASAIQKAVRFADSIAAKFRNGRITHTFVAALPSFQDTGSGRLEVAVARQTESFRLEDELKLWNDWLSLGTTVTEIKVPVTYRYYIKLSDPWRLEISGRTCLVYAPRIRPNIPPAIDTSRLEKHARNGWARFNANKQMTLLEEGLTPTLVQFAEAKQRMGVVREQARKTVASFVRDWLLQEDHWRRDRFHTIRVFFANEPASRQAPPPALRLE